ncbi:MAG: hypothetical protein OER88_01125 [Planctomycetota bacterium]|nr:hypothetical protein [Planctomycetota bacterium]
MTRKKVGGRKRRWLRWTGVVLLVAGWLAAGQVLVRGDIEAWLNDTFDGKARVRFVLLWPDLDATAFGVSVKGKSFDLRARRTRVDLNAFGLFGDEPVEAVEVTGLTAHLVEGEPISLFRADEASRPSGGAGDDILVPDLDPLQVPPLTFRDPRVVLRGETDTEVFSTTRVAVEQVGDRSFELTAEPGMLARIPFEKLTTRLIPRAGHVLLNDVKLRAFNGVIGGIVDIDTSSAGLINGDVELHFVEVERLWETYALPYAEKRRGDLSGHIVFEGDRPAVSALKGTGNVTLKRARFFSPLSFKVLVVMKVPAAEESMLTGGAMSFSFERSLLYVERGRFDARGFDLAVQGIISFDGAADLEIKHAGTTVSVSGKLEDPRIKVLPLNGLTAPFDRLFRERVRAR